MYVISYVCMCSVIYKLCMYVISYVCMCSVIYKLCIYVISYVCVCSVIQLSNFSAISWREHVNDML